MPVSEKPVTLYEAFDRVGLRLDILVLVIRLELIRMFIGIRSMYRNVTTTK